MKNHALISVIVVGTILLLAGCGGDKQKIRAQADHQIMSSACYRAINNKDTALLVLHYHRNKGIQGKLTFVYKSQDHTSGNVNGKRVGDTLFLTYIFMSGKTRKGTSLLAFLNRNDSLLLGIGIVKTYLGKPVISKGDRIDFYKGRFVFLPIPCNEEINCSKRSSNK